jgi:hypothetical protein
MLGEAICFARSFETATHEFGLAPVAMAENGP